MIQLLLQFSGLVWRLHDHGWLSLTPSLANNRMLELACVRQRLAWTSTELLLFSLRQSITVNLFFGKCHSSRQMVVHQPGLMTVKQHQLVSPPGCTHVWRHKQFLSLWTHPACLWAGNMIRGQILNYNCLGEQKLCCWCIRRPCTRERWECRGWCSLTHSGLLWGQHKGRKRCYSFVLLHSFLLLLFFSSQAVSRFTSTTEEGKKKQQHINK